MTVGDHFERVAAVYESLRTTDEAPVRRVAHLLPDRPVTGLDVGCGTGRYSRLLRGLLPDGSRLVGSDVSAAMLVLGYLTVDFGFTDRDTLTVYLSVIIRHDAGGWRIVHYQVSRLDRDLSHEPDQQGARASSRLADRTMCGFLRS